MVKDTHKKLFDGIKSILRSQVWWSAMRLRMPRKRGAYEQIAVFVATTQLLGNYSRAKESWLML